MFRTTFSTLTIVSHTIKRSAIISQKQTSQQFPSLVRAAIPFPKFFSDLKRKEIKSPLGNLIDKSKENAEHSNKDPHEDEAEEQKKRESQWRTMKITFGILGLSFISLGGYLILTLGAPPDQDTTNLHTDVLHRPVWQQYLIRTYRELRSFTQMIQEPSREKLLPDPLQYPYKQPKYTLVLEITDVLVHPDWTYSTGWRFKKRPGLDYFLETLSGVYEIVIYTAEQGMMLFPLCEAIDPKNIISYKLPRDTTYFVDGHHVKSLDKLNRDLSKVVVVDWQPNNVKFHPENLFAIKKWDGSDDDTSLYDLAAFLISISTLDVEDVREVLSNYRVYDDPIQAFNEKRKQLAEQMAADAAAKKDQNISPIKRFTSRKFNTGS